MRNGVRTEPAHGRVRAGGEGPIVEACPELDCVRSRFAPNVLEHAMHRAAKLGISADRVLIADGKLTEEDYLRTLAASLGVAFESLDEALRADCPLTDERLTEIAREGLLPFGSGDDLHFVVAPRGIATRRVSHLIKQNPAYARRFRFTTAERFNKFILRHAGYALSANATNSLHQTWPALSAAPPFLRILPKWPLGAAAIALAALAFAPAATLFASAAALSFVFLAWLGLRLIGAFFGYRACPDGDTQPDDALPVYTVIAALYREAKSVDGLLRAIERLDYPHEKLDVIIAIEADDHSTREALSARTHHLPLTVVPAPPFGPRTKPKALNVALPFAHGAFLVVYDAEDRPEPDQLRRAIGAFRADRKGLACVQARLCIDNGADSWIAQLLATEYAGQFDVFLPGFAALGLPLPLGGSSNHFRTDTLRALGGWDPYNVTEDADLGMRLARFGCRTAMIDSSTHEEAPIRFQPWVRQRTRWFKGWMQTWLVHMRHPMRLLHDLGLPGFVAFQLIVGGNVLSALVHPVFLAALLYSASSTSFFSSEDDVPFAALPALYGTTAVIGYLTSAFLGWLGLLRRGLTSGAWILLLTPLHWLMLSLAAWRALYYLVRKPHAWEKTEHGFAKTSRRADRIKQSLSELERYLSGLKAAGELPELPAPAPARATVLSSRPRVTA